jgi:hypothetical protein
VNILQEEEKERPRKCSKKEARLNFLRGGTTADIATGKMDDTNVDEDKCCLLSLLSSFRQFNDEQKFMVRMEILKLMQHVKLQQNATNWQKWLLLLPHIDFSPFKLFHF